MPRVPRMDRRLEVAVLLTLLTATGPARSQSEGVAESLFRQAREEMKQGKPETACPKFDESYRLDPSAGTLLNLALCEEALGHTATAWTKLRQFVDTAPVTDDRLPFARERMAKLEAQLPWVKLTVEPADEHLVIQLDDIELRRASLEQPIVVNPGEHVLRLRRSTGESSETPFHISPAEKLDLRADAPPRVAVPEKAIPAAQPAAAAPDVVAKTPPPTNHRNGERTAAYALGGVGIAGLVTGGIFGIMAIHDRSVVRENCPNHECRDQTGLDAVESGHRNKTVATVATIAGAACLAAGGILLWHSGRTSAGVSVSPNSGSIFWVGSMQ